MPRNRGTCQNTIGMLKSCLQIRFHGDPGMAEAGDGMVQISSFSLLIRGLLCPTMLIRYGIKAGLQSACAITL